MSIENLFAQISPWVTWATNYAEALFARFQVMFDDGAMVAGIIIGIAAALLLQGILKMLIWAAVAFLVLQYFNAHLG